MTSKAIQFPVSIVFIDDDSCFGPTLTNTISEYRPVTLFNSPQSFLDSDTQQAILSLVTQFEKIYLHQWCSAGVRMIDVQGLVDFLATDQRFAAPGLAMIDYHMPGMTGFELCRHIHAPILRYILTGHCDAERAMAAKQNIHLDNYIEKVYEDIMQHVINNFDQIDKDFSDRLINASEFLSAYQSALQATLNDENYYHIRDEFLNQQSLCEHYVIDSNGSLLAIDENGECHWLLILSQQQKDVYYQQAKLKGATEQQCQDIRNNRLPVFLTEDAAAAELSQWNHYALPFKALNQQHYYAIIRGEFPASITEKAIFSLQQSLELKSTMIKNFEQDDVS